MDTGAPAPISQGTRSATRGDVPLGGQEPGERRLLERIEANPEAGWEDFLHFFAPTLYRIAGAFARSYDERMDLFVRVAEGLREKRLQRVRAYRFRPEAPCTLRTFVAVVARNLILDYFRSRDGRFRPFRNIAGREEADRLIFQYHIQEHRPLVETQQLLEHRHGLDLDLEAVRRRSTALSRLLSPGQRWRLLSRLLGRRRLLPIHPTADYAGGVEQGIPLRSRDRDPESLLGSKDAAAAFQDALERIGTRLRLALALRYQDGLKIKEAAAVMSASEKQVEHWVREGTAVIRRHLASRGFTREDLGLEVPADPQAGGRPSGTAAAQSGRLVR